MGSKPNSFIHQTINYYKKIGINNLMYFDLDKEFDKNKVENLLNCNAIHLSGGNTLYFLNLLQKRNFIKLVRNFVNNEGILIGVSAGGILMSKRITAAKICDDNYIGLDNLNSLSLVNFDFFPHWNNNDDYLKKIINYSKKNTGKICYLCKDSDGIVVKDNKIKVIGTPLKILNGKIKKL
ncbi:MAG: Type 1 glutamine amidotransferase-like domain-containing protein [bacterium]